MSKTKMYDRNDYIVLYDDEENYKIELSTLIETQNYLGRGYYPIINAINNHTRIKSKFDGKSYFIHKQRNCVLTKRKDKPLSSSIKYFDVRNRIVFDKEARNKLGDVVQVDIYPEKVIITKAKEED